MINVPLPGLMTSVEPIPYGTPSSLSLVSPQELPPWSQIDITSVPDSPVSRGPMIVDEAYVTTANGRESTKSESPELGLSVHDVPPLDLEPAVPQPDPDIELPEHSQPPRTIEDSSPTRSATPTTDGQLEVLRSEVQRTMGPPSLQYHITSRRAPVPTNSSFGQARQINGSRRHTEQVYDEIESDWEGFQEKQRMHSAKRLKIDRTFPARLSSPHTPLSLTKERSNGSFRVPGIPASRENGLKAPAGDPRGLPQRLDVRTPTFENAGLAPQRRDLGYDVQLCPDPDSVRSPPSKGSQPFMQMQPDDDGAGKNNSQRGDISPAEVGTANAKGPAAAKNWSDLDIDHPVKQALSQGRKPDFSPPVSPAIHEDAESNHGSLQDQEAERVHQKQLPRKKDAKGRRHSTEIMEKKTDPQAGEEASSIVEEKASQDTAEESTLPEESYLEESSGPEQLKNAAMVTSPSSKSGNNAHANVSKDASEIKALPASKVNDDDKISRGRQSTEIAMSKIAEQKILEAESAKQLQAEKLQKQKNRISSGPETTIAKAQGLSSYRPRTEAEKAKRREREQAKRREIDEGKVAEQAKLLEPKSPDWANKLFQAGSPAVHQSSEQITADSGKEKTLETSARAKSPSRSVQKPKVAPAEGVYRSSPARASNQTQKRRSLTPALPNTSATKSPSNKSTLLSSSPLASRSPATLDTPLRSALKQNHTSSTLRRSVSFLDDKGDSQQSSDAKFPSKSPAIQGRPAPSLVEIHNELALKVAPTSSRGSSKASDAENNRSKIASEPVAKQGMIQQKLNVTRDKKLKGRAMYVRTSPSKEVPKQENKSSSSEDESSSESSSDEDLGNGNAKAGPSSRKEPARGAQSKQNFTVQEHPSGTSIDPAIEEMSSTRRANKSPHLDLHLNSVSNSSSQRRSASRSPAQRMSANSVSSGSKSGSDSASGSGSETSSREGTVSPVPKESSSASSSQSPPPKSNGVNTAIKGIKHSPSANRQSSKSTTPRIGQDAKDADKAVEKQLQLECRQSVPIHLREKISSIEHKKIDPTAKPGTTINGHLPQNTQPAFRYPTLTMQRKMAKARTADEEASALVASQRQTAHPVQKDESSSSSDEESSNDSAEDGDEDEKAVSPSAGWTSSKTKSGGFPGLRNVLKSQYIPLFRLC